VSFSISKNNKSVMQATGKIIYIVGPMKLQNHALASCLKGETGDECFLLEHIEHIPQLDDHPLQRLVLFDCHRKDPERILAELRPYLKEKPCTNHTVLFNVPRDQGVEGQFVLEGIQGFFYEQDSLGLFLKGIRAVCEGEIWLSREIMTKCIVEGTHKEKASKGGNATLAPRQNEILALIAVGGTNDEIADKLCISPHTVKTHLYNIFKKINVQNRMQAALWAAKNL
jgi:LuxR family transcriptional regulator of csgAB operon